MSKHVIAEIMGINRLRMGTDGEGIFTLVTFYGCHLSCRYCLNPQCKNEDTRRTNITPEHLVDILSVSMVLFFLDVATTTPAKKHLAYERFIQRIQSGYHKITTLGGKYGSRT